MDFHIVCFSIVTYYDTNNRNSYMPVFHHPKRVTEALFFKDLA